MGLPVSSNPKKRVKRRSMRYSVGFTLAKIHPIVCIAKHFARKFCKTIPSRSLCPVSGTTGQYVTGLCQWSNLLRTPSGTSATWANTPSACVNHLCQVTNTLYTCVNTFCHPGKRSRHVCKSPLSPLPNIPVTRVNTLRHPAIHSCHLRKLPLSPHQTLFTHKTGDFDTLTNSVYTRVNDVCHPDRRSLRTRKRSMSGDKI